MLSHLIEVRKFLDKKLFCDFQVASIEIEIFDKVVETDKWLRFEDWQQLYERLDKILLIHSSPDLGKLYTQDFQISNNVQVHIEKLPLESAYRDIFSLDENEVFPIVLLIKINKINVDALNRKIAKLEKYKKSCRHCYPKDKVKIKVRKDLCKEYDPVKASGGGHGNIPVYKPSTKTDSYSVKTESRQEEEEYSPKPINNQSETFNFEEVIEGSLEGYNPSTEDSPNQNVPAYIPSEIKSLSDIKEEIVEISSTSDAISPETKTKESTKSLSLRSARKRRHSNDNTEKLSQEIGESAAEEGSRQTRSKKRKGNEDGDNEKCRLSQDLFGSDDSDPEKHNISHKRSDSKESSSKEKERKKEGKPEYSKSEKTSKSKQERAEKLPEKLSSKRLHKDEGKNYESKKRDSSRDDKKQSSSKSSSKENGKCTKKKQKSSKSSQSQSPTRPKIIESAKSSQSQSPTRPKLTEEEKQRNRDNHEKEMEILKTYKEGIQALNKSPPPVDIIKLNHLTSEELVKTFEDFKPLLDKHFKEHKKRKTHVVKTMEDMDHLLTMSIIEDDKLFPLLNHLKMNYETDADNNVPCYTDLFMNLMLPEWILAIFMKVHHLERREAIERIKTQNQLETSNSSFS